MDKLDECGTRNTGYPPAHQYIGKHDTKTDIHLETSRGLLTWGFHALNLDYFLQLRIPLHLSNDVYVTEENKEHVQCLQILRVKI